MTVIGVDLGGTNVRAQQMDAAGRLIGPRAERPSQADRGVEACVEAICDVIQEVKGDAKRVGMAVPGHLQGDVVKWAPNFGSWVNGTFEFWKDVNLVAPIRERVGLDVVMGNDANLAALGEYRFGAGQGNANGLVMITLGTGIGTGVILSPKCVLGEMKNPVVLVGGNGGGVEMGHIVIVKDGIEHPSAVRGTLEAYCGTHGILIRAAQKFSPPPRTPQELFELAKTNNHAALEIWRETGDYLGVGIANIINTFAPEIVAIGGQIAKACEFMLPAAIESARKYAIPSLFADTRILQAEMLDDAGILGAGALALMA